MAGKLTGLGSNFYIGGYNLSGDVNALSSISTPVATLDVTAIDKYAMERRATLADGTMSFTTVYDTDAGQEHLALSGMPRTDTVGAFFAGTTIGNAAASINAKQVDSQSSRDNSAMLTRQTSIQANSYGLDWGTQLTAGVRTDTAATNGSSWDGTASTAFGFQAYLQMFAFSGTDVTIKIQDSANNSAWTDLASGAFAAVTSGTRQAQRIAVGGTATVRRYLRVSTVTTGGFTSCAFAVTFTKNQAAVSF